MQEFQDSRNEGHLLVIDDNIEGELYGVLKHKVHDQYDKWGVSKGSPARKKDIQKAKKKVDKFVDDYHADDYLIEYNQPKGLYKKIVNFYDKYRDKMKEITKNKLKGLTKREKKEKKNKRVKGYLPEESDLWLLVSAISANKQNENPTGVWSMDSDFTEFDGQIKNKFSVEIFDDNLPK